VLRYGVFRRVVSALCVLLLSACSTTQSDVRIVSQSADLGAAKGVPLSVVGKGMQTSYQDSGRLYTLHTNREDIIAISRVVARHYGFKLVPPEKARYEIEISSAVPDGGACMSGVDSAEINVSYSLSLLTLGAFPATAVHCLVVEVALYKMLDQGERELMAEFSDNSGQVEAIAGVNDLKSYQRTVKAEDERRGLEVSFGQLLKTMIDEGAFEF